MSTDLVPGKDTRPLILLLGPLDWNRTGPTQDSPELKKLTDNGNLQWIGLGDLPAILVAVDGVAGAISPLFWPDGDALETARLLHAVGFAAPYFVVAPPLPRPSVVEREIRSVCPGLDVRFVTLPADDA